MRGRTVTWAGLAVFMYAGVAGCVSVSLGIVPATWGRACVVGTLAMSVACGISSLVAYHRIDRRTQQSADDPWELMFVAIVGNLGSLFVGAWTVLWLVMATYGD